MRVFKKRFLAGLAGAILCAGALLFFLLCISAWHAAALFAAGAAALTVFALRAAASCRAARLICENSILNVGMASVAEADAAGTEKPCVTAVISGFGILMDGRPYQFGHGGVDLTSVEIDRERIRLSFGENGKTYSVRLLHGVADKAEIDRLADRLRYETGVAARVHGW